MTIHVPPQKAPTRPAPIAFLGEAPSTVELERGQPLVGPSGKIFNAMLRTAELERSAYWIGNVFDEKLPDNEIKPWCAPLAEARAGGFTDLPPLGKDGFLRPEYRWHLARLRDELEAAQPNVIVALGATALWALTGQTNIGQMRGAVTAATLVRPGAKVVPSYHPAFVMKQWKMFHVVVGDFIKAAREAARGPLIVHPHKELLLEPTLEELQAEVPFLLSCNPLSVDIETSIKQVTCIGLGNATRAICVPFWDKRRPSRSYWDTPEQEIAAWQIVKGVLESDTPKLGQNYGAYDGFFLLQTLGIRTMNLAHDTRLLHHALYPELPKDLAFLGAAYSEQGPWKIMRTRRDKRDD